MIRCKNTVRAAASFALALSLFCSLQSIAHADDSTLQQQPGTVSQAEDLALGGMLENRKTGERLGLTCTKVEEKTIGEAKVKTCTEVEFFRANAKDQALSVALIGPRYSPQKVRDDLKSAFDYSWINSYDTASDYLGLCGSQESSTCSGLPVYGLELTGMHVGAVEMGGGAWRLLYTFLPATIAVDIVKDAVVDPVLVTAVGVVDAGVLIHNAANEVVVGVKNAAHQAAANRLNRKFTRAVVEALAQSKRGDSMRIKPAIFDSFIEYLSQCDEAWANGNRCELGSFTVNE